MSPAEDSSRTQWWSDARFGMFVHFGLYSLAARHEWVQSLEKIDGESYRSYFDHFVADRFDAVALAKAARKAGMRYAVLTAKHHEGFCLWDSALTDFTSAKAPAGRNLVTEFVNAFRAEGIRVGLYYSLIDWHHPDFPIDGLHPDWERSGTDAAPVTDGAGYVEYLHAQISELFERYRPDIAWLDFSYPGEALVSRGKGREFWGSEEIVERIRAANPEILINDRLDLPGSEDFITPEDVQPSGQVVDGEQQLWEACRTLNGSWGYAPDYQNWLDSGQIVKLLVDSVSKNGNLLLNVGPTGRGDIEEKALDRLGEVGHWLDAHSAAIYQAGGSRISAPEGCRITQNGSRVFLHVFDWPTGHIVLQGLPAPLRYASLVHDGREVAHTVVGAERRVPHEVPAGPIGSTVLQVPRGKPDVLVPVIELDLGAA